MKGIKERLNDSARRLAARASDLQYLSKEFGQLSSGRSGNSAWQTPAELPPEGEIPSLQAENAPALTARSGDKSLSDEEERRIRPAFLATYFLQKWFEWEVVSRRWIRFSGASSRDQFLYSVSPEVLDRAGKLVDWLAGTPGYLEAYSKSMRPGGELDLNSEDGDSAVSQIIQFGEHDRLVRGLRSRRRLRVDQPPKVYRKLIEFFDSSAERVVELLPNLLRQSEVARRQLRAYKYSTLNLSWLRRDRNGEENTGGHLIGRVYDKMEIVERSAPSQIYDPYFFYDDQELFETLVRIHQTVREIGLRRLVQTVTDKDFQSGPETPVVDRTVEVIGGRERGPTDIEKNEDEDPDLCIALSISDEYYPGRPFANGDRGSRNTGSKFRGRQRDLNRMLDRTQEWLVRYGSPGTAVLIITDLWAPKQFASQYGSVFEAWGDQGISTVIAVPNADGNALSFVDGILP